MQIQGKNVQWEKAPNVSQIHIITKDNCDIVRNIFKI